MRTLVSKKLPGICLFPVEFKVPGQPSAIGAQPVQEILSARLPRNSELALPGDVNVDLVALLESQGLDHGDGKADGETVAPFGDLHGDSHGRIHMEVNVYPTRMTVKDCARLARAASTLTLPHGRAPHDREGPSSRSCRPGS